MLASVEPRGSSGRRTRWRSTARGVWRMGESSGRVAAGRFPMVSMWSFSGVLVVECVATMSSKIWWTSVAAEMSWVASVERGARGGVEEGGGGLGDGVDGGAAGDVADVEGEEGVGGEVHIGDLGEGAAEEED